MPIFRRKSSRSGKEGDEEPGVPELDVLKLPGNRSLVSLAGPHRYGTGFETTAEAGPGKDIANAGEMSGANTLPRAQPSKGGRTPITPPMTPPTVNQEREGAQKTQSPLVPAYHRPWTKELAASKMGEGGPQPSLQQKEAPQDDQPRLASPSKRNAGPPPSAYAMHKSTLSTASSSSGLYSVMGLPLDFRVSPNLQPQQSPSQRKSMVDAARKMSLKRSKAPSELNIMVVGGRATGKTSWIRTLLSTCDLSVCSEEAKLAAASFGLSTNANHSTRKTTPPTPVRTRSFNFLNGIELPSWAILPLQTFESGGQPAPSRTGLRRSPSILSSASSGQGTKLHVSVCDTPGYDFSLEDEFETERKTLALLRYIEGKLNSTLIEESKVQRQARGDDHVHLVLYFIDPLHLVERTFARRADRERMRLERLQGRERSKGASAADASATKGSADKSRPRSASAARASDLAAISERKAAASTDAIRPAAQRSQSMSRSHAHTSSGVSDFSQKEMEILVGTEDEDTHTDDEDEDEDEEKISGLSSVELSIIARLSERTNVVPILAKSDLLTAARTEEVRSAVQASLVKAKIDLGAFDIRSDASQARKEAVRNVASRSRRKQRGKTEVAKSPMAEDEVEEPDTREEVKVIKLRPRRSYSGSTGSPQLNIDSVSESNTGLGIGASQDTTDAPKKGIADIGQEDSSFNASNESPEKNVPFTLFSPEPVRPSRKDKAAGLTVKGTLTSADAADYLEAQRRVANGMVASSSEDVPPVPPLPKEHANQASPILTLDEEPSELVPKDRKSADAPAMPPLVSSPNSHDSSYSPGTKLQLTEQEPNEALTRFERAYKWGSANVLDPTQSDFAMLRTCLLGTHIEAIKEFTAQRYEQFRAERLEARRFTREMSETQHRQLLMSLNSL